MIYKFKVYSHRAEYIKKDFTNAIISEQDDEGFVSIELTIDDSLDILKLFHSGVNCGHDTAYNELIKSNPSN